VAGGEIERLYRRGFSCAEIGDVAGRSETFVYNYLKAAGTRMRSRSEANKEFPDEIAKALYNLALSASQIGHLLGVHPTTVVKRLRSCGFPMRPKKTAAAIGYSDEEFRRFFCTPSFTEDLRRLVKT